MIYNVYKIDCCSSSAVCVSPLLSTNAAKQEIASAAENKPVIPEAEPTLKVTVTKYGFADDAVNITDAYGDIYYFKASF